MDSAITVGLIFDVLIAFVLPIAALSALKVRTGRGMLAALVGVACFFVFAMLLEQLLHMLVMPYVMAIPALYCTYGCLAAGVFEETARLVGLSFLCKKDKSLVTGVGYGIGHGGGEAALIVGINVLVMLVMYVSGNGDVQTTLNAQYSAQPWMIYLSGVERISAMALQMALSILIWMVVVKRVPFFFYFIAILIHALADLPAAYSQISGNTNVIVIECIVAATAFAVCIVVKIIYDKSKKEPTDDEENTSANTRENADITTSASNSEG